MPTAFVVFPYHEPHETLYRMVLEPTLQEHGFLVIRADLIPNSNSIIDDVHEGIRTADIVVVEVTELNANVYYELGFAVAHNKETILLTQDPRTVPFDTTNRRHLVYGSDLEAARELFRKWLVSTRAYRKHQPQTASRVLNRGDLFSMLLDSAVHVEPLDPISEDRLLNQIRDGAMLPCKFSYATERGTLHWLRLCEDPTYTVYRESIQLFSTKAVAMLQKCDDSFLESSPDVISLGPGNGHKDRLILVALAAELERREVTDRLFYYPIDISHPMLSVAHRTILQDPILKHRVRIKAIASDFANIVALRPIFDFRPQPNLFLFLGNTLGNIQDEISFLHKVRSAMHEGDILILEVRLRTDHLELGGSMDDQHGLAFSALRMLGVPYEEERITHQVEDTVSQIPGTITVSTRMRDVRIGEDHYEDVFLSCVNYFDRDELCRKLEGTTLRFEVLETYCTSQVGVFLLRKPRRTGSPR